MKKLLSLLFVVCLLLAGCGSPEPETVPTTEIPTEVTTEATTEPTTEPTTVPTEPPVYYNPLTGEEIDEPYTGRLIASIVSNTHDAIPHAGVTQADILFEVYASYGVVRCLALYSDVSNVEAMGSVRSTRLVFNDLAEHYDALLFHAAGSPQVLEDIAARGIDNFNLDHLYRSLDDPIAAATGYRTPTRYSPHNLYGYGPGILEYLTVNDIRITQPADKHYHLNFAEDGTPVDGEAAEKLNFWFGKMTKDTTMIYDAELGKYVWEQYWGTLMKDEVTDEVEAFRNVLVLRANTSSSHIYQVVDFVAGGEGYFACGGKYIPILWGCNDEQSPLWFTTLDGEPLTLGVGNTYIGILDYKNELKIFPE